MAVGVIGGSGGTTDLARAFAARPVVWREILASGRVQEARYLEAARGDPAHPPRPPAAGDLMRRYAHHIETAAPSPEADLLQNIKHSIELLGSVRRRHRARLEKRLEQRLDKVVTALSELQQELCNPTAEA